MHTNPIIICFCSILYYKDLAEHVRRYRLERKAATGDGLASHRVNFELNKFKGRLSTGQAQYCKVRKEYKKIVLIRWHLFLRLHLNKELIKLRKHYVNKKKKHSSSKKTNLAGDIKTNFLKFFKHKISSEN